MKTGWLKVTKHYGYQHGPNAGCKTANVWIQEPSTPSGCRWDVNIFNEEPDVIAIEIREPGYPELDTFIYRGSYQENLLAQEAV